MSSPFQGTADAVMAKVVSITGDSRRNQSPYYKYGRKTFDDDTNNPPQVRWAKGASQLKQTRDSGGYGSSGSMACWWQTMEVTVWGKDEEEAFQHWIPLAQAIRSVTNTPLINPQNLRLNWLPNDSQEEFTGEMISLNVDIPVDIPHIPALTIPIASATLIVSSTNATTVATGSMFGLADSGSLGPTLPAISGSVWVDLVQ